MNNEGLRFKVIHWDGFENLFDENHVTDNLALNAEVKQRTIEDELPIIFTWKYHIYKEGCVIFSYISETRKLFQFPETDIQTYVTNEILKSYSEVEEYWESQTKGTTLSKIHLAMLTNRLLKDSVESIIGVAKEQNLL